MRKIKKVTKTEVVTETVDIICNKCGHTCSGLKRYHNAKPNNMCGFSGLIETEVHGGYDSEFIGDMISWKFSLCEECLNELVKTFKIPHEIKSELTSDYVTLAEHKKVVARHEKLSHEEWVKVILEKKQGHTKKELKNKTHKELYDIYHSFSRQVKRQKNN